MAEVNFYLKKAEKSTGKSLIVLYKRYKGNTLVVSTGQTVNPKSWNKAKQRVKNNSLTTEDGKAFLNDFLKELEKVCEKAYSSSIQNGIPSTETIRKALQNYINREDEKQVIKDSFFKLVNRFIEGEIKTKGKDKSLNTLKNYKSAKNHLESFQSKIKTEITFDNINLDFFYSYTNYLKKVPGLATNSIAKQIKVLKVFMAEAVDLGLTNNMQFKHKKFTVQEQETDSIYLNEHEITKLYKFDLSKNKKLERVRDLFVFACYVGLRYSDY